MWRLLDSPVLQEKSSWRGNISGFLVPGEVVKMLCGWTCHGAHEIGLKGCGDEGT